MATYVHIRQIFNNIEEGNDTIAVQVRSQVLGIDAIQELHDVSSVHG